MRGPRVSALPARIERQRADLVAFLRRRAPDHAEELAQDVWLRVARAKVDFATEEAFRAYVYTVARRLLIDHYRKQVRSPRLVPLDGPEQGRTALDPEGIARAADVHAVVDEALATMKPEIAEVFRWRAVEDVPFAEIARRQGTPLNTALGRMHKATRRLADALVAAGLLVRSPFGGSP